MEVQIISSESIKPSSPTPPHLLNMTLSFLDQKYAPLLLPTLLFYDASKGSAPLNIARLKTCLSETLSYFYPLAGRYRTWGTIHCNDEGIPFVEAKVNCSLSDVLSSKSNPAINFISFYPPKDDLIASGIHLAIQVNEFTCGGFAIGWYHTHKVTDGTSAATFLRHWAALVTESYKDAAQVQPDFSASVKAFPPIPEEVKEHVNEEAKEHVTTTFPPKPEEVKEAITTFSLVSEEINEIFTPIPEKDKDHATIFPPNHKEVVEEAVAIFPPISEEANELVTAFPPSFEEVKEAVAASPTISEKINKLVTTFPPIPEKVRDHAMTFPPNPKEVVVEEAVAIFPPISEEANELVTTFPPNFEEVKEAVAVSPTISEEINELVTTFPPIPEKVKDHALTFPPNPKEVKEAAATFPPILEKVKKHVTSLTTFPPHPEEVKELKEPVIACHPNPEEVKEAVTTFLPITEEVKEPVRLDPKAEEKQKEKKGEWSFLFEKRIVAQSFVFKKKAITELKAKSVSDRLQNPSRFVSIAGFLWKQILLASPKEGNSMFSVAVNLRSRSDPPMPETSIGNLIEIALTRVEKGAELPEMVAEIHKSISNMKDIVLEYQGENRVEAKEKYWQNFMKAVFECKGKDVYALTSWCGSAGFGNVDFGFGKPKWIVPIDGILNIILRNTIILTECTDSDGNDGFEAWMFLEEETMKCLETNAEFIAFASPNFKLNNGSDSVACSI